METKIHEDFKKAFKKDHGIDLPANEAREALENLTRFFNLTWQFDQKDKQKEMKMGAKPDGKQI